MHQDNEQQQQDVIELEAYEHQIGGHVKKGYNLLKYDNNTVLKPFQDKGRGEQEASFYKDLGNNCCERCTSYFPNFFGTVTINSKHYIHMGDILSSSSTSSSSRPNIMDLKMGKITYDSLTATLDKIQYEDQKSPLQHTLGFRIQGIRSDSVTRDKYYGRSLHSVSQVQQALKVFLFKDDNNTIIEYYVKRLSGLRSALTECCLSRYNFVASSILLTFCKHHIDLRVIDFTHTRHHHQSSSDSGFLHGVQSLIKLLERISNT